MATLLDLAARCNTIAMEANEAGNELKKQAAIKGLQHLVDVTPVDTSEAISNWQIGLGQPVSHDLPPYAKGKKGSTAQVSRDAALHVGMAKIAQAKPGQAIYLSNLAGHIRYLNNGSSRQAPAGFIEATVILMQQVVKTAKLVRLRK